MSMIQARCQRCKRMIDHDKFPIVEQTRDRVTKRKRVKHDVYCAECRPFVTAAMRRADLRDPKPADR